MDEVVGLLREIEGLKRDRIEGDHRTEKTFEDLGRKVDALRVSLEGRPTVDQVKDLVGHCASNPGDPLCKRIRQEAREVAVGLSNPLEAEAVPQHESADEFWTCEDNGDGGPGCAVGLAEALYRHPDALRRALQKAKDEDPTTLCQILGSCGYTEKKQDVKSKKASGF